MSSRRQSPSPRRRRRSLSPVPAPKTPSGRHNFYCGPCDALRTDAVAYCKECHDFFCPEHLQEHNGKPATKWHKLVPTDNMKRNNITNPGADPPGTMTCETHRSEKLNMYCHKHDTLCCEICAKNDHYTCGHDLKYIPAISAGIESTIEFENTRLHLKNLVDRFNRLKLEKDKELDQMRVNREKFLVSVREMKLEVLDLFDLIERDAKDAVDKFCKYQSDEIAQYKRRVDTIIESIKVSSEHLSKGVAKNDSQMFVNAKRAAKAIVKSEQLLYSTHQASKRVNFTFWLNSDLMGLVDLVRQLRTRKPLVSLPSSNGDVNFPVSKLHAKIEENCKIPQSCICTKPYRHRALVSAGSFNVRVSSKKGDQKKSNITQCVMLANGSFLMVDNANKAVKFFNHAFHCHSRYKCTSTPWDIAVIDKSNAVVSLPDEKSLQMLNIAGKLKAGRTISMAKKCFGVAFAQGYLIAACGTINNAEIRVMDLQGVVVHKIFSSSDFEAFRTPKYVIVNHDLVFVSDPYANTVTSLSMQGGTIVGQYKSTGLVQPSGMCRDPDGNIYVCGRHSNNIHQLSSDLKAQQIFTPKEFQVLQPQAVAFSNSDGRLLVTTENHDLAEIFKLV